MSAIQNRQPAGRPTGGRFATASHAEAGAGLAADTVYSAAAGDSFDAPEACDGIYLEQVNLLRADDGARYWISSVKQVDVVGLVSRHLLGQDGEEWLDRHAPVVTDYLDGRYTAETSAPDGWREARIDCQGTIEGEQVTAAQVADAVWEGTKTIKLHNESDPGTYGHEDLGRLIVEHVAAQRQADDTAAALRLSRGVVPADGAEGHLEQVGLLRNAGFPVADAVAVAAARSLGGPRRPALKQLGERGYADEKDLRREAYAASSVSGCTGRANLVAAWVGPRAA